MFGFKHNNVCGRKNTSKKQKKNQPKSNKLANAEKCLNIAFLTLCCCGMAKSIITGR